MKTLDEIKKEISMMGVNRARIENHPPIEKMTEMFYDIMRDILARYDRSLDEKAISSTVEFMVKWSYQIGDDIDFRKGFMLAGKTGRGKTFLFRAWDLWLKLDNFIYHQDGQVKIIRPQVVNTKRISGEYQDPTTGGYRVIERYGRMHCLMLDDIGKEDDFSLSYGNKVNIIEEIINLREENDLLTFATTNLSQMSKTYDDRTVSRMNRLFTIVPLKHDTDFRLK
jgi:DNA replication protein DnaC